MLGSGDRATPSPRSPRDTPHPAPRLRASSPSSFSEGSSHCATPNFRLSPSTGGAVDAASPDLCAMPSAGPRRVIVPESPPLVENARSWARPGALAESPVSPRSRDADGCDWRVPPSPTGDDEASMFRSPPSRSRADDRENGVRRRRRDDDLGGPSSSTVSSDEGGRRRAVAIRRARRRAVDLMRDPAFVAALDDATLMAVYRLVSHCEAPPAPPIRRSRNRSR